MLNPREISDVKLLQELLIELLNAQEDLRVQLSSTEANLRAALDEIKRLKGEKARPQFRTVIKKKRKK